MPTVPKDHPRYKEWRDREKAAKMIRRLQDPIKAQDQDRKKSDKKYHSDPHYRQQRIEASRRPHVIAQRVQYRQKLAHKQREGLRRLILRRPHIWKHMIWRTHAPVLYDQGTKHRCATCGAYPYLEYKLWWKRHDNSDHDSSSGSDLLECHACFGGDWSRAMPIGYEDFVFAQGKVLHLRDTPGATTPSPHSKGEEGHDGNHG